MPARPRREEPWFADDPWGERTADPTSGWGDWPPADAPGADYLPAEPEPPVNDPWAESWDDDGDAAPPAPAHPFE
ncbi:MAG: hypothetical protein H0U86_08415, partial [Chloroflexi bacterium]|nr:hypothetical protein [Chloroflexota bacterium]